MIFLLSFSACGRPSSSLIKHRRGTTILVEPGEKPPAMTDKKWRVKPASGETPAMVVYGEVDVQAPPVRVVGATHRAGTVEQIMGEASDIWRKVKSSGIDEKDEKGNDDLLTKFQEEHKDFAVSFPVPLRWIVQARQFHPEAFRKFLAYYQKATKPGAAANPGGAVFDTRQKFIETQAEYLVFLQKALFPKYDMRRVREYRKHVLKMLLEEDKEFSKIQEEVAEELKEEQALDKKRRAALYEILLQEKVLAEKRT